MILQGEKFDRWLLTSLGLHVALFAFALVSPSFLNSTTVTWGSESGGGGGIQVSLVQGLSGIPLPAPPVVQPNAPPSPDPVGLNPPQAEQAAPVPQAPAPAPAQPAEVQLPSPTAPPARTTPPPAQNAQAAAPPPTPPAPRPVTPAASSAASAAAPAADATPSNAISTGSGGSGALPYGQFSTGTGAGGLDFGGGAFGSDFGWYVESLTRTISQNWVQPQLDNNVRSAPRVYVRFTIARNGTISNVSLEQTSGIPAVDRSAQRAVQASTAPSLPAAFTGSSVTVRFYFDYVR